MKLLHVVPTYLPAMRYGGPIYAIHGLCKSLVESGAEVSVFTTNVDGDGVSDVRINSPIVMDGVEITYFESPYLRKLYYSPTMKLALDKQIDNFDLVHGHSIYLWPTMLAARACLRSKTPYVLSPRGMLVKNLVARKNWFIKWLWIRLVEHKNISLARAIHFTSQIEAQEANKFRLDINASFVVPNGIDVLRIDKFKQERQYKTERHNNVPSILYLGRINWKKGLDRLIKSMTLVNQAKLIIAGNDEEDYTSKLRNLISAYNLENRIEFIGPRYGPDKYSSLLDADIFVLPSYSENFGNTVLESMACGCPVIVTSEVGLASKVKQTESGIVVDGEPESIAEAINTLLVDRIKAMKMGKNGSETARREFSWQRIAHEMCAKYQEVIDQV